MDSKNTAQQQGPGVIPAQAAGQPSSNPTPLVQEPEATRPDQVNSREEVPSYVPTREEVFELVKYMYRYILDGDLCWFFCGVANPKPKRYYWSRIDRADAAIGKEAVDGAIAKVREEFKKSFNNDRVWEILWHGTEEEKAALEGCSEYYWGDAVDPASEEAAPAAGNGSTPSVGK